MDKTTKKTGSLAGIVVGSLIVLSLTTALAYVANSHSAQYKDCVAQVMLLATIAACSTPHRDELTCQQLRDDHVCPGLNQVL